MRSRTTALLVGVLLTGLSGGLAAGSALAEPPAPATTELVGLAQTAKAVLYDGVGPEETFDTVGYAARLTVRDRPVAGATLTLERRLGSRAGWTAIATEQTDDQGWGSFLTEVAGTGHYRISFDGDEGRTSAVTDAMRLRAMRDLNAEIVKRGSKLLVRGDINPGWKGKKVTFQKKKCATCRWKTVERKRAKADGRWQFRAGYPAVGAEWRFRAKIGAASQFVGSTSDDVVSRRVEAAGAHRRVAFLH